MRLSVIQMDMRLGESSYNFAHAEALLTLIDIAYTWVDPRVRLA